MNRQVALQRAGGDETLLGDIIRVFLEECPIMLDEIQQGLAGGQAHELARRVHRFKGSISNFGAEGATAAASNLESATADGDLQAAQHAWAELKMRVDDLIGTMRAMVKESSSCES